MSTRLTLKQEAFVEAYLRLQNGRKAYKEAYDKTGKMKDSVAVVCASQTLSIPKIQEAVKARQEAIRAANPVSTIEELAEGWTNDIRFDLAELVDEHGAFRSPKDLSRKTRRLIQGVEIKESLAEEPGCPVVRIGIPDVFPVIGSTFELRWHLGLCSAHIVEKARRVIRK